MQRFFGFILSAALVIPAIVAIIKRHKRNNDGKKHVLPPWTAVFTVCGLAVMVGAVSVPVLFISEEFFYVLLVFSVILIPAYPALINSDCVYDVSGCVYTTVFGNKREYSYQSFSYFSDGLFKHAGSRGNTFTVRIVTDDKKTMYFNPLNENYYSFLHNAQIKNKKFRFSQSDPYDESEKRFPDPYDHNIYLGWLFFILYLCFTLMFGALSARIAYELFSIKDDPREYTKMTDTLTDSFKTERLRTHIRTGSGKEYTCLSKAEDGIKTDGKTLYILYVDGNTVYGIETVDGNTVLSVADSVKTYRTRSAVFFILSLLLFLGGGACFVLSFPAGREPDKHLRLYSVLFWREW